MTHIQCSVKTETRFGSFKKEYREDELFEMGLLQEVKRDLNTSHTPGYTGEPDSKTNPSGHDTEGGSRSGQTHKKLRDLSVYDREERGCGMVGCCLL